ncbi:MAG: glycosyltransferase family 4 protein [Deltaproteobacteria bacterium]|nr:glycosyltransferase family 4 protein [Deltaproteobacteria bacterium]MBW2421297.1 glycosyltransferase family 4 protein [Deltaproteobacteria bacterium]
MSVRVAIACSGVGHVRRGYESITRTVWEHVRGHVDVTLFKGFGPDGQDERTVRCLRRTSLLGRAVGFFSYPQSYKLEGMTFARSLFGHLRDGAFDVVFAPGYGPASALCRFRDRLPPDRRFAVALHNSAPYRVKKLTLHPFDLIQQVTGPAQDDALAAGLGNTRLVPLPVDLERFGPGSPPPALRAELDVDDDVPIVLCVAAHMPVKRIDVLVEAVASLRDPPTPPPVLLIAGQEGEQTRFLRDLARDRLGSRVRFRSYAWEQMPDVYRLADVFALPSRREGFGMALLEAMATGLPVVTQDDAVRSWIVDDAGLLVECGTPGALSEALARVITNADERRLLAEAGRERVRTHFSWEVLLPKYLDFFEEAAATVLSHPRS